LKDTEQTGRKSWDDARSGCEGLLPGASLAVIPSNEYNSFIYAHMFGSAQSVWVGGRADQNREWTWADNNTAFIYSNWAEGEPNNSGGTEACLEVQRNNGRWNDNTCEKTQPYICSVDKAQFQIVSRIQNLFYDFCPKIFKESFCFAPKWWLNTQLG